MSISLLLEMAASSNPDRTALVDGDLRWTTQQLSDLADGGAGVIARPRAGSNAQHVVYVGAGGAMLPLLIFASARAGLTFTPINYRLSAEGIEALIRRLPEPLVIVDERYRQMVGDASVLVSEEFLTAAHSAEPAAEFPDPDSVAIVLFILFTIAEAAGSGLQFIYPNELFPTDLRATGMGLAMSASRIGAAAGTLLLPTVLIRFGSATGLLIAGGISLVGLVVSVLMAPETRGVSLGATSAPASGSSAAARSERENEARTELSACAPASREG